jgi:hypothetical protein
MQSQVRQAKQQFPEHKQSSSLQQHDSSTAMCAQGKLQGQGEQLTSAKRNEQTAAGAAVQQRQHRRSPLDRYLAASNPLMLVSMAIRQQLWIASCVFFDVLSFCKHTRKWRLHCCMAGIVGGGLLWVVAWQLSALLADKYMLTRMPGRRQPRTVRLTDSCAIYRFLHLSRPGGELAANPNKHQQYLSAQRPPPAADHCAAVGAD